VQVAGGNDVTDAEALRQARQLEHGLIIDPRHPLAQTGFGRSTYEDPTGATQALGEAYLRAYGELALGVAAGPLARGALSVDAATAAAGGVASEGIIATRGFRFFFGRSGILNSNQYLRIGLGRDGGNLVFRASGSIVERITESGHIVFKTYGKF